MPSIYIIDQLRVSHNGLETKDCNGNWTDFPQQQGTLGGACVVYSAIMALLSMGYISKEDIDTFHRPDRRTSKGKLLSLLLDEQGFVREGYQLRKLKNDIEMYCHDLDITHIDAGDNLCADIGNFLDNDIPVIISLTTSTNSSSAHAVLAIGSEYTLADKRTKLFCIDPGFSCTGAYWNCLIDTSRKNSGKFPYWYLPSGHPEYANKMRINEILIIQKNK